MRFIVALALIGCIPDGPKPDGCVAEPEICDAIDNDCDGVVDEGVGDRWYGDSDGDGFGDAAVPLLTCDDPGEGWVAMPGDCDDTSAASFPGAVEICNELDDDCNGAVDDDPADPISLYLDADGDGLGDPTTAIEACSDPDRVDIGSDCDDTDATIGASVPMWDDADGDGFGAGPELAVCEASPGLVDNDGDCDDLDPGVNPAAVEVGSDGLDGDCDGLEICFEDGDLDGYGSLEVLSPDLSCDGFAEQLGDCDDSDPEVSPGAEELCDNGIDDDCDPLTPDVFDNDGDGLFCNEDCDDNEPATAQVRFEEIGASAGVSVPQGQIPNPCGAEVMSGAAAIADYDGDGDLDIFLPRMYLRDLLFENDGTGGFTEVSAARNLLHTGSSNGAVWFDADGDGDLDLFVSSLGMDEGNRLYLNLAGSSFLEQSVARGVDFPPDPGQCSMTFSVSAADIDGDGDVDLHQTAWEPDVSVGNDRSRIWLNDGTGFFSESTALDLQGLASFTSDWGDFDGDGDLDAAVASDWGRSTLWRQDAPLSFSEISAAASVGTDENGMGSAIADVDGDGDLDWFVSSIYDDADPCPSGWGCTGNRLYLGLGDLTFFDATDRGVRDGAWSWGAVFFDYDNDGDLDLGVENGFPNGGFSGDFTRLYDNDGSTFFTDVACETGLARNGQGRTLIPFDMDRDGDLDVLMVHNNEDLRLFESIGSDHGWLTITLSQPSRVNRFAIGAQVYIQPTAGQESRQDIHLNAQFAATAPAEAHFGLGDHVGDIAQIRIVWPDGAEQLMGPTTPNQVLEITRSVP